MKEESGKAGSPVTRSIRLTDSPKTWLCVFTLALAAVHLSGKDLSVEPLSWRRCGKRIKTEIKKIKKRGLDSFLPGPGN